MTPRGIRNHNPGNIRLGPPWQGLATEQSDGAFCQFTAPEWGIRALARTLITYGDKRRSANGTPVDTIGEVIARWAPDSENDTAAYVASVSRHAGRHADEILDFHDYDDALPMVRAIVRHENGPGPLPGGEWYADHVYDKGLMLAGIEPPKQPLTRSRTVAGTAVAGTATLAGAVVDAAREYIPQATEAAQTVAGVWPEVAKLVAAVVILSGLALVIYARFDDRRKGLR